ncbi:hypothetical protein DUNSADRAFT_16665 [Dunaliella salina]|uniref:Uncharacterized protein n=1 Tax=Dunaliella salina TaxID=3046 RepID=A0ABQ7G352_DUNSA|nr:hypothetical protein DUNSADRAFT_16665 [Dunaliella salina]|eukprot:KAF5829031.1 hypothetical protein DUNSADRAFT_16665 [Dunaliella salina]
MLLVERPTIAVGQLTANHETGDDVVSAGNQASDFSGEPYKGGGEEEDGSTKSDHCSESADCSEEEPEQRLREAEAHGIQVNLLGHTITDEDKLLKQLLDLEEGVEKRVVGACYDKKAAAGAANCKPLQVGPNTGESLQQYLTVADQAGRLQLAQEVINANNTLKQLQDACMTSAARFDPTASFVNWQWGGPMRFLNGRVARWSEDLDQEPGIRPFADPHLKVYDCGGQLVPPTHKTGAAKKRRAEVQQNGPCKRQRGHAAGLGKQGGVERREGEEDEKGEGGMEEDEGLDEGEEEQGTDKGEEEQGTAEEEQGTEEEGTGEKQQQPSQLSPSREHEAVIAYHTRLAGEQSSATFRMGINPSEDVPLQPGDAWVADAVGQGEHDVPGLRRLLAHPQSLAAGISNIQAQALTPAVMALIMHSVPTAALQRLTLVGKKRVSGADHLAQMACLACAFRKCHGKLSAAVNELCKKALELQQQQQQQQQQQSILNPHHAPLAHRASDSEGSSSSSSSGGANSPSLPTSTLTTTTTTPTFTTTCTSRAFFPPSFLLHPTRALLHQMDTMSINRLRMPSDFQLQAWLMFCSPDDVKVHFQGAPLVVMATPSVLHLMQALVMRCIPKCSRLIDDGQGNMHFRQQLSQQLAKELSKLKQGHSTTAATTRKVAEAACTQGLPSDAKPDMATCHWSLVVFVIAMKVAKPLLDRALDSPKLERKVTMPVRCNVNTSHASSSSSGSSIANGGSGGSNSSNSNNSSSNSSSSSSSNDSGGSGGSNSNTTLVMVSLRKLALQCIEAAQKADCKVEEERQMQGQQQGQERSCGDPLDARMDQLSEGILTGAQSGSILINIQQKDALLKLWGVWGSMIGANALVAGSWLLLPEATLLLQLLCQEHGRDKEVAILLPLLRELMAVKDPVQQQGTLVASIILNPGIAAALGTVRAVVRSTKPSFFLDLPLTTIKAASVELKQELGGKPVSKGFKGYASELAQRLGYSQWRFDRLLKRRLKGVAGHPIRWDKWELQGFPATRIEMEGAGLCSAPLCSREDAQIYKEHCRVKYSLLDLQQAAEKATEAKARAAQETGQEAKAACFTEVCQFMGLASTSFDNAFNQGRDMVGTVLGLGAPIPYLSPSEWLQLGCPITKAQLEEARATRPDPTWEDVKEAARAVRTKRGEVTKPSVAHKLGVTEAAVDRIFRQNMPETTKWNQWWRKQ